METIVDISACPCPAVPTPRETSVASTDWAADLWPHTLARADQCTGEQLTQIDWWDSVFPDFKMAAQELYLVSREYYNWGSV